MRLGFMPKVRIVDTRYFTVIITYIALLGRAQPVIPPNLYSAELLFMNNKAWGPQVNIA